jgi:hypothetical protein
LRAILKQALYAYPLPLAVTVISILAGGLWRGPWFGAGQPGWALLLLSLPWTLARILVLYRTGGVVVNRQQRRVARTVALCYPLVALACAAAIGFAMGYTQLGQAREFLLFLFFPFTLPVML